MHILVVNDDGPPSPHSSPYIHSLVRELEAAGHVVSVCLPHVQRSWIGKAHMIGQTVKPLYYSPPASPAPAAGLSSSPDHGTTRRRPSTANDWVLVDGTPASCVQIGLYHYFQSRGPVELVLSGPNYGRNTTAVFALSSGTLGGALEAAVCRRRAVALSYAFFSRNHDPEIIAAAGRQSVAVVEALVRQWPTDGSVDLYSVNVPLVEGLEQGKVLWTDMLQNYWDDGSCFTEIEGSVDGADEEEERIREEGEIGEQKAGEERQRQEAPAEAFHQHKHFKWSPRFTDVYKSVEEAPPGNDGWAVKEGHTSVTPLKANFFQTAAQLHGKELKLETRSELSSRASKTRIEPGTSRGGIAIRPNENVLPERHFYALVAYEDDYVQPLIISALQESFTSEQLTLVDAPSTKGEIALSAIVPSPTCKILQIMPYEVIDFEYAAANPHTCLVNSYMIRKALIRKHFLAATADIWVAKHPDSALKTHVKRSEAFEVDYAEFLDDALVEAFDLRASLERNAGGHSYADVESEKQEYVLAPEQREWWILKPGMSDRGQGIRLFSTMEELQGIFDKWEAELPDSDEDEEEDGDGGAGTDRPDLETDDVDKGYITASHLRHFVAQPYIHPPLLLPQLENRKFHVRVYVLAVGSMRVYVYREMLALFAAKPYTPPWLASTSDTIDLDVHLTNTCLQGSDSAMVKRYWDLPLPGTTSQDVFAQICAVTGETFEAAARGSVVHFQPLPNAFEVFGVDFLVDAEGTAWLLEVNAFPDFRQTGDDPHLRDVVAGLWKGVVDVAVRPFVHARRESGKQAGTGSGEAAVAHGEEETGMVLVRNIDLGRRWS